MIFSEKLQVLRKNKGFTQEAFAEKLNVSRQAVAKWESGQVYPDIGNLIEISNLLNVSVDYLVKDQDCAVSVKAAPDTFLTFYQFERRLIRSYAIRYVGESERMSFDQLLTMLVMICVLAVYIHSGTTFSK